MLNRVVQRFLETAPGQMLMLRDAVHGGECQSLQQVAHSLKSSTGNVGALGLSELFSGLEGMGREQNVSGAASTTQTD